MWIERVWVEGVWCGTRGRVCGVGLGGVGRDGVGRGGGCVRLIQLHVLRTGFVSLP